jgi:hypothetical protein
MFAHRPLVRYALVFCLTAAFACKTEDAAPQKTSSTGDGAAKKTASSDEKAPSAKSTSEPKPSAEKKAAQPAADIKVDLAAILGEKKDGWSPKVISGLKRGMKPEEAAKVFPGAEKIDKFGFVEIPIKDHPGLEEIRLYFAKNKDGVPEELQSVKLGFSPALNNDTFWDQLSKACIDRYGKADDKELAKRLITWVGPKSGMAQLVNGLTENHGFTLDVTLQR